MMGEQSQDSGQTEYIAEPRQLEVLCERLRGQAWIAVDTEFLREKTYFPKLCLIQLGVPGLTVCVDPLKLDTLDPLLDVLYDRTITKLFHASSQDLEIFCLLRGEVPGPVFDTQIAAPLLGLPEQLGYAGLVKDMLGIDLDKGHSRTDWSARPLTAKQIEYALADAKYLAELYPAMRDKLEQAGRLSWLEEDFRKIEDKEKYRVDPARAWLRVRGYERLKGHGLSILQLLAEWREQQAQHKDRPRNWIMRDDILMDLSRLKPDSDAALARIRNLNERTAQVHGKHILELISNAAGREPDPAPIQQRSQGKPSNMQEALADVLQGQLRLIADSYSINASVLATRKQLMALVRGERNLAVLEGWRRDMAGLELIALLEGNRTISVCGDSLLIEEPAK